MSAQRIHSKTAPAISVLHFNFFFSESWRFEVLTDPISLTNNTHCLLTNGDFAKPRHKYQRPQCGYLRSSDASLSGTESNQSLERLYGATMARFKLVRRLGGSSLPRSVSPHRQWIPEVGPRWCPSFPTSPINHKHRFSHPEGQPSRKIFICSTFLSSLP